MEAYNYLTPSMRMDQQPTATISGLLQIGMSPKRCPVWTSTKTMFQMHEKLPLSCFQHVHPSKIPQKPLTGWSFGRVRKIFDMHNVSENPIIYVCSHTCFFGLRHGEHLPSMLNFPKEKYLKHLIRRCRNSWRDSHPNQFFTNFKPGIVFLVDLCPFPSSAFYLLVRNYPFVGINLLNSLVSMGVTYNDPALWISRFPFILRPCEQHGW